MPIGGHEIANVAASFVFQCRVCLCSFVSHLLRIVSAVTPIMHASLYTQCAACFDPITVYTQGCAIGADPWQNMQPHASNHRAACDLVMQQAALCQPVFTMEQEYTITAEPFNPSTHIKCEGASAAVPIKNAPGELISFTG
jgi:hypothetical protein